MDTRRRIASLLALSLALSSASATAFAQSAPPPESKVAAGEALADQAFTLYKEGRFSESVAAYSRAYELTGSSVILFNIANIYDRKMRELDLAADYYRRYLRTSDAAPDLVRKANDRLDALKQQAAPLPQKSVSAGQTPAPAAPPPDSVDPVWRTTGLVVGGLGIVSLGVSAAFALQAKGKSDDSDKYCTGERCTDPRGPALAEDATTAANVSTITFGAGLLVLAGGALLYFAGPSSGTASSRPAATKARPFSVASSLRAAPNVGPHTASLTLTGAW
jgi:tetratricopeptide (TPR) repeat protein